MSLPDLIIEIAFGDPPLTQNETTDPGGPSEILGANWTDVTAYARGNTGDYIDTKRGRRNELSEIEASEATVVLDNTDRRFDPNDSTSPYWNMVEGRTNIQPMTKIRIGATWSGTTYWQFTGYVERWDCAYPGGTIATATLTCVDAFKYLNLVELTDFSRSEEKSGVPRIDAILTEVDWPDADRALAIGDIDVAEEVVTKVSALSAIRRVALAERGLFFISGAGNATFQDRGLRNGLLSVGHWTNNGSTSLGYSDFRWRLDDSNIWNDIRVTRSGGIEQASEDSTSIAAYFRRTLPLTNLPLVDDAAALDTADWTLAQFKDARVRPDVMVIDPAVQDSWATVLNLEISDVMLIDHTTLDILAPDGSVAIAGFTTSLNAHVEGIHWRIRKGLWELTLSLSPSFVITAGTGTINTTDDWIVPTFEGTWDNYDPGDLPVGYRKEGDWVYLRGTVDGDVADTNIFYLRPGYRPPKIARFYTSADPSGSPSFGRITILTNGAVKLTEGDPWIALNGISFRVI